MRRQQLSPRNFFSFVILTLVAIGGMFFFFFCVSDYNYAARISNVEGKYKKVRSSRLVNETSVSSMFQTSEKVAYRDHIEENILEYDEEEEEDGYSLDNHPIPEEAEREELEDSVTIEPVAAKGQDLRELAQLQKVNTFLSPYLKQMQVIRKEVLASQYSYPDLKKRIFKLYAHQEDVFDRVKNHPQINLIQIQSDFEQAQQLLLPKYYDITSSDCQGLTYTPEGKARCINAFNITCFYQFKKTLQPKTLATKTTAFTLGLPWGNEIDLDNLTLTYMMIIPKAVISHRGDVLVGNISIIPRRCQEFGMTDDFIRNISVASLPEYEEVFSAYQTFGRAVYHGTVESLQRLVPYLQFLKANPRIKIHLGSKHPFLPLLGLDPNRVIVNPRVRAKVVYLPAGVGCCTCPVFTTQLLALHLRAGNFMTSKQDTVILIRRSKEKGRYFRHHGGILRMLEADVAPLGMKIRVYGDYPVPSLQETRQMFQQAAVVISPHGAGASNLLFSQPGTLLIEGLHAPRKEMPNLCFLAMSQALGLRYHGIYINDSVTEIRTEEISRPLLTFLGVS